MLDQLYAMQANMIAEGGASTEEQSQAQMMAGMALMQGVSLAKLGVRFDDYGITGRTLEALAAQNGVTKNLSSAASFQAYANEIVVVPSSGTITLKHTPAAAAAAGIPFVYKLRGDDGHSTSYAYGATASASAFTFTGATLTPPTGLDAGTRLLVPYYYTADDNDEAVRVAATGKDFTTPGRMVVECLAHDPCSPSSKIYAMLIFPNAKLSGAYDIGFGSDSGHPFEIEAMQDYCGVEKLLYELIVPEDAA